MQIKNILIYHVAIMEFAKIQKFDNFVKAVGKLEGNGPYDILLLECKMM